MVQLWFYCCIQYLILNQNRFFGQSMKRQWHWTNNNYIHWWWNKFNHTFSFEVFVQLTTKDKNIDYCNILIIRLYKNIKKYQLSRNCSWKCEKYFKMNWMSDNIHGKVALLDFLFPLKKLSFKYNWHKYGYDQRMTTAINMVILVFRF